MKKINNKGFMLVETLVCATFIVGILIVVYVQFRNIDQSYEDSFKYNTVNNLYLANQARIYLNENGLENLKTALTNNDYIDITTCPAAYLEEVNYCKQLFLDLNIKQIIFSEYDLKDKLQEQDNNLSLELLTFIQRVNLIDEGYVIYIEFNDDTYAILKVF